VAIKDIPRNLTTGAQRRYDDFLEQTRRYSRGEIGLGDQMLQGAANTVGMFADVPLTLAMDTLDSISPEVLKKGAAQLQQGIMETDAAKAAMKVAQENPQMMKRLGYGLDLSVLPAAKAVKGGMLQDLSMEAPNRQPFFYGSGVGGKAGSILTTAPTAIYDTLSPGSAASRRGGTPMSLRREASRITPERRQKVQEIKDNKRKEQQIKKKDPEDRTTEETNFLKTRNKEVVEKETSFVREFNKDLSFLEGQLDQTQLLSTQRKQPTQGVVKSFEKVQARDIQPNLTPEVLDTAAEDIKRKGINLSKENFAVMEERIRKAQKIAPNEQVQVVVRDPTAFSDLSKELLKGPSKVATRVFHAKDAVRRYFPDQKEFTSQELREFVAMTRLPDDKLYKLSTGKEANRFEQYLYKAIESDKYGTKGRPDKDTIDMYYKYKEAEQTGKKLTKTQREIYDAMKARVQMASETVDVRGDTAYFSGSHKSSAKGLGGVGGDFLVKTKGDFAGVIHDENDLFGLVVPGDTRIVSIPNMNGYNVFGDAPSIPSPKPQKQVFQEELQQMGANPVSQRKEGMLEQAAVAIQNQPRPDIRPSDFKNLATAGALAAGATKERQGR
jgi:hypothetical protein